MYILLHIDIMYIRIMYIDIMYIDIMYIYIYMYVYIYIYIYIYNKKTFSFDELLTFSCYLFVPGSFVRFFLWFFPVFWALVLISHSAFSLFAIF